jgi:NADH:ubiquinone reductase (H+-translocating)
MSTPKVVILGAGYGGVVTTQRLQKILNYNEADITLVNKNDYHYITTELHQPAAGTMHHERARVNITELISENSVNFVQDSVVEIKTDEKKVLTEHKELDYDYLVVGLGWEPETFGIPGLKENAFSIRNIDAVREIRQHIEYQFARYKMDPSEREHLLTFIIGGAGFTGIEFVGELADRIPELCKEYDVSQDLVRIINVEAAPTALPGFDPRLVEYAMDILQHKGVEFKIDTPIEECTPESVVIGGEEIKAGTFVWTGGIRGNSVLDRSGFETMRGRIKVDEYLRAPSMEDTFIIGDCALIINEEINRPYPPTAQMAIQHAFNVADNLAAIIRKSEMKPFKADIKGTVASLGRGEAIGIVGKKKIMGSTASMMKKIIDLRYLFIIGGLPLALRKGRFW